MSSASLTRESQFVGRVEQRLPAPFAAWFAARGWQLRRHQAEMLELARQGRDALLIAPTGGGKTLGGFLPSLVELHEAGSTGRLHTLYVSPLKALTTDIARNLTRPVEEMGLAVRIETRTGDTPQNRRARQRTHPPDMLLTTPESLALLLSYENAADYFASLRCVVLDELHALAESKRGALFSLARGAAAAAGAAGAVRRAVGDGGGAGAAAALSVAAAGGGRDRPGRPGRRAAGRACCCPRARCPGPGTWRSMRPRTSTSWCASGGSRWCSSTPAPRPS